MKFSWILMLAALAACQNNTKNINPQVSVKTSSAIVKTANFEQEIKGYGTLLAQNSLDLEAKFDGIVHFESLKGKIKKGTVIYTIGGPEVELKKENLQKSLANAKTQFDYFKQYYEAKKILLQKNYLSKIDFEKISRDFENAQNKLNTAEYALDYFMKMTTYKAPFDGYLDHLQVPQGEDAVMGQLLGTFQDDDHLKLVAAYYGDLKKLEAGHLSIIVNGMKYNGKIIYKEQAIDPSTGGHTLWIALNDPGHQLKSGSYVPYSFLSHKHRSIAVPEAAIIQQDSKYFVIRVQNGKYQKTTVLIGQEKNGMTEIKSGLKEGDSVLTQGAFEVFYGKMDKMMKIED
jgi:Cu(I)/Ag(I) efflux system membrane fusion protein/cobalt-zinc-cadmium efflux system membrane fusion protein